MISFRTRKKIEPFSEEKKKGGRISFVWLKNTFRVYFGGIYCLTKPSWFFLLACAFCTETRGQEACKHIHISNQALAESGRPQLLVVYEVSYPLSAPPLFMWDGRPWSSFSKKERKTCHPQWHQRVIATPLLVETWHFNRILRKLLGQSAIGKFTNSWWLHYEVMQGSVMLQNHRHSGKKKKGMHIDVHFIVIYSSRKMGNNSAKRIW